MTSDLVPLSFSATSPQSRWLVDQLPAVLAEDPFLRRFLGIFEEILTSVGTRIDGFEHFIDLSVTPIEFVRWMGRWVGLQVEPTLPDDRQRELVRRVGPLFAWRGTALGMVGLLEAVTGHRATVTDSGGVFSEGEAPIGPKRVKVELESAGDLNHEQVLGLVQQEMPADVRFELYIGGRLVPSSYPDRPSPRLEKEASRGEEALLGFATGRRRDLDDAAMPTTDEEPPPTEDEAGPEPGRDAPEGED